MSSNEEGDAREEDLNRRGRNNDFNTIRSISIKPQGYNE